ncbi:MAG: class I SAM-dependent methyltransferase [Pseudomonadota bacterium]
MSETSGPPRDRGSWDSRYVDGFLPWDTGRADAHLLRVVEERGIRPGRAVELGCGTGTNSIWLAQQGFDMTGLDLAPTAVQRARAKAEAAGVACEFVNADILNDPLPAGPFDFAYDRGCLHTFALDSERTLFVEHLAAMLAPGALWHSLIGSTDGPPRESGPPRRSAAQIASAVEPHFEILELRSTSFDSERHAEARAWVLVARRRGNDAFDAGAA